MLATRFRRVRLLAVGAALGAIGAVGPVTAAAPLATAVVAPHPMIIRHLVVSRGRKDPPSVADCQAIIFNCYRPSQIQAAYDLGPLYAKGFNGAGRTIVIVDSFGSPTIQADLNTFDQSFGLPDPPAPIKIIAPAGPIHFNNTDSVMLGWAGETTLDVEWAHSIAPGAKILLVETPVAETEGVQGFPEMMLAENYVINHNLGDVISQSFGATEETFPNAQSILKLRSAFKNAYAHDVTVLAASGDFGPTDALADTSCCYPFQVNSWPSSDPLVTSLGGTQLHLDANGAHLAPDNVWNDFAAGGGGPSHVFGRPDFQNKVRNVVGTHRGTPDISMSAACVGAVLTYSTFDANPNNNGWSVSCGTSEASPLFSGIVAIADQMAGHRLGYLNDRLYKLLNRKSSGIVDVTIGNNTFTFGTTTVPGYAAAPGYDLASGLGTLDANRLVRALAKSDGGGDQTSN